METDGCKDWNWYKSEVAPISCQLWAHKLTHFFSTANLNNNKSDEMFFQLKFSRSISKARKKKSKSNLQNFYLPFFILFSLPLSPSIRTLSRLSLLNKFHVLHPDHLSSLLSYIDVSKMYTTPVNVNPLSRWIDRRRADIENKVYISTNI